MDTRDVPTTFKSQLGPETVRRIAEAISAAWPAFPSAAFRADATRGLARLELLARGDHVARALRRHLPPDLPHALEVLVRSLGPDLPEEGLEEAGAAPFLFLPYSAFVRNYGLAAFEASMDAQHALTVAVHRRVVDPALPRAARGADPRGARVVGPRSLAPRPSPRV